MHDESAVAVRLLRQAVELGNGIVESLLGKVASTVGRVQDLVVEDREVQRKAETDGVGRCELSLGNVGGRLCSGVRWLLLHSVLIASYLVGLVCSSRSNLALLTGSEFGEVAVVVSLPVPVLALFAADVAVWTHILW